MDYRGIEYHIVQTANPTGWKWTVILDAKRQRTGITRSRAFAAFEAEHAIDKAIEGDKTK